MGWEVGFGEALACCSVNALDLGDVGIAPTLVTEVARQQQRDVAVLAEQQV
jgi:hypothetical protein